MDPRYLPNPGTNPPELVFGSFAPVTTVNNTTLAYLSPIMFNLLALFWILNWLVMILFLEFSLILFVFACI